MLDNAFAFVVEGAGRLVEYQNSWICNKGAGDCNALTLPPRKGTATLADDGVIAFREFEDELVRASKLGGGNDLLHRHSQVRQRNVVPHAPIEQYVFL